LLLRVFNATSLLLRVFNATSLLLLVFNDTSINPDAVALAHTQLLLEPYAQHLQEPISIRNGSTDVAAMASHTIPALAAAVCFIGATQRHVAVWQCGSVAASNSNSCDYT
tara:strand:- start:1314 stop:1643 length:330 start_codon:yes stop_codon:yes gene_type:complete